MATLWRIPTSRGKLEETSDYKKVQMFLAQKAKEREDDLEAKKASAPTTVRK